MNKRLILYSIPLCFLFFLGLYFYLIKGSWDISLSQISQIFYEKLLQKDPANRMATLVVFDSRLPRFLVAFLVGASLSITGCIMQSIFQNPMASPGITGTSAAAGCGAVFCIVFGWAQVFTWSIPILSIIFALGALLFDYTLASSFDRTSSTTLLLIGIALSLFFSSLVTFLITISLRDWEVGKSIISWTLGELQDRRWEHVYIVATTFIIGLSIILYFIRDLDLLIHGEEIALNLGVSVVKTRFFLLVAGATLVGGAVGVAGMIGFIGLIIPHVSRILIGNNHKNLVFFSMLLGGVLLVYCDLLVRIFPDMDLRIGTITGLLGSPYFIFLILHQKKNSSMF